MNCECNWLRVSQILNSCLPSHTPYFSLGPLISLFDEPGPQKWRVAKHTHTRPISDNDGSHATLHVPPLELRIGPALKQAYALVHEGGMHILEGKEKGKEL